MLHGVTQYDFVQMIVGFLDEQNIHDQYKKYNCIYMFQNLEIDISYTVVDCHN